MVSWYRILQRGDSSFFHCRIRCCRGTASPFLYMVSTRYVNIIYTFFHSLIALLEKIFHLSLLEKKSQWACLDECCVGSRSLPPTVLLRRQVTGSEVNSAPDVADHSTFSSFYQGYRWLCDRAKLPRSNYGSRLCLTRIIYW